MRNLINIANELDKSGQFRLSDKLFKLAIDQTMVNKINLTPEILSQMSQQQILTALQEVTYFLKELKKEADQLNDQYNNRQISKQQLEAKLQAIQISFNKLQQEHFNLQKFFTGSSAKDISDLDSQSPNEFAKKLLLFSQHNNISNLAQAFDAYARNGARYQKMPINSINAFKILYSKIINTPRMISEQEIASELNKLLRSA